MSTKRVDHIAVALRDLDGAKDVLERLFELPTLGGR